MCDIDQIPIAYNQQDKGPISHFGDFFPNPSPLTEQSRVVRTVKEGH